MRDVKWVTGMISSIIGLVAFTFLTFATDDDLKEVKEDHKEYHKEIKEEIVRQQEDEKEFRKEIRESLKEQQRLLNEIYRREE
jgi:large-conductance mechanosensitive channel